MSLATDARAHGDYDWINKGKYRSPTSGELCCGKDDCYQVSPAEVTENILDYFVHRYNFSIRKSETLLSEDGKYWLCTVGSRMRCFFAPKPIF